MFKLGIGVTHRMAPPTQTAAKQHGYTPLRAASPPRDGSTSREYPLNRRVSPGVEHRRPAPRGNIKGGKTTIAPGQVPFERIFPANLLQHSGCNSRLDRYFCVLL